MGGTMAELKIIQSNMMALMACDALRDFYPGERPYVTNRAGYAGIQRYAQVWGGDNVTDRRTLKYNVALILGMGLSGVSNTGCDIGGFAGPAPSGELLLRWFQNGIFCANDYVATGAITAAQQMGRAVPDNLLVLGFDNRGFSAFWPIPISTFKPPLEQMGQLGMQLLLGQIQNPDRPPRGEVTKMPAALIIRKSTCRPIV